MIRTQSIEYKDASGTYEGTVAYPSGNGGSRPVVLVTPTIRGRTPFEIEKARALAEMGYIGFAIDVYGKDKQGLQPEQARAQMDALNADRAQLLSRMNLALSQARKLGGADAARIAAIGYCFGGKCVLDLARSGAELAGVVSFHGVLDPPGLHADTPIKCRVLVLHGWDDPLAPPQAVVSLAEELTRKGARWELDAYGHTGHAFTNPQANNPDKGLLYNPDVDRQSWQRMKGFLADVLGS